MAFSVVDTQGRLKTSGNPDTVITSTATGAQNDWAPGISGHTLIEWNGASDIAVTGLAAGVTGQRVTIKNITSVKIATFAHNSGSSSAGNKLLNSITSGTTPIAAGGFISYVYDGTTWQLTAYSQGLSIAWTPVLTFATPGDLNVVYAAGGQSGSYTVLGNTIRLDFYIETSTFTWSTSSGRLRVTGQPFTGAAYYARGAVALGGLTKAGFTSYAASIDPSATLINIFASGSGVTSAYVGAPDMPSGGTVVVSGTLLYHTT